MGEYHKPGEPILWSNGEVALAQSREICILLGDILDLEKQVPLEIGKPLARLLLFESNKEKALKVMRDHPEQSTALVQCMQTYRQALKTGLVPLDAMPPEMDEGPFWCLAAKYLHLMQEYEPQEGDEELPDDSI